MRERIKHIFHGPLVWLLAVAVIACAGFFMVVQLSGGSTINVLGSIRERGTIRIGVLEDNAPYCTVDEAGNATGFEAELAMQIGREILQGEGVQLVPLNIKTTRANLDQENCDLLVSKVVVNETNSTKYALSSAYAQEPLQLLTRTGQTINLLDGNLKIGVIPSSNAKSVLTTTLTGMNSPVQVMDISSYPDALTALQSQKIDAFCAEASVLRALQADGMQIQDAQIGSLTYAIAVRSNEKDLADAVKKCLTQMRKDGTLDALYNKYAIVRPAET